MLEDIVIAHIDALPGEIASVVLLPGDPLRAWHIAETLLQDSRCYNRVRGMYGFTGTYRGARVSVQATGMGIPSAAIYVRELVFDHGAKILIRVGTCGALQPDLELGSLVMALSAATNSNICRILFGGVPHIPTVSERLAACALRRSQEMGVGLKAGRIFTSDMFYLDDPAYLEGLTASGILVAEMETAGLYALSAKYGVEALSLLTVTDSILSGEALPESESLAAVRKMAELALEVIDTIRREP
jgi:purine-nucleoside phosphorylase